MQNEQCYEKLRLLLNTLKSIEVLIEDMLFEIIADKWHFCPRIIVMSYITFNTPVIEGKLAASMMMMVLLKVTNIQMNSTLP